MDIKIAVLAALAFAAVLRLPTDFPRLSYNWLTRMSTAELGCNASDAGLGCQQPVERSRWTRPELANRR